MGDMKTENLIVVHKGRCYLQWPLLISWPKRLLFELSGLSILKFWKKSRQDIGCYFCNAECYTPLLRAKLNRMGKPAEEPSSSAGFF